MCAKRVTVRVPAAFQRLAVNLAAVVQSAQQFWNFAFSDLMPRPRKAPPLRAAAPAAPGRDGKAGSPIDQESWFFRDPIDNATRRREHPGEAMPGPLRSISE